MRLSPLLALALVLAPHSAFRAPRSEAADDDAKVAVRWFGQSCFQIETTTKQLIVFDPHAIPTFNVPRLKANITLISHEHNDHNQSEVLEEKGREFRGIAVSKDGKKTDWNRIDEMVLKTRVRTLATYHDPMNGMQRGKNSIWIVETDGLVFCHLGDLGHELTPEQVKAIGPVDVLMIPVGGIYTINGEVAKKVVSQIKPTRYILPMHYGVPGYDDVLGPDEFLDEQKNVKKMPETNELLIPVDAKATDAPAIVLLGWKKAEAPEKK